MTLAFAFDLQLAGSNNIKHEQCLQALKASKRQSFPCNRYEDFKDLDDSVLCYDDLEPESIVYRAFEDTRDDHYHLALLGYGEKTDSVHWVCSGSVISNHYILTAAHCTSNPIRGKIKFAALAALQSMENREKWQIYEVVKIIVHPAYKTLSKYDDIALLQTRTPIMYNRNVIPACLHRGHHLRIFATATGWGSTEQTKKPVQEMLQGTTIKKFSDIECRRAFPQQRHLVNGYFSASQACYGDQEQPNDVCEGDSGGPLQVKNSIQQSKCLYTILGVTSYGRACGHFGTPGLFTRVNYYVPWIESITGKLS